MKRLLSILAVVLALCLSGCQDKENFRGYVVGKRHSPAHTTRHYNHTTHTYNTVHHPETWYVWVADSTHVERFAVRKRTFDNCHHGQLVEPKPDL